MLLWRLLLRLFEEGGLTMWPILFVAIISIYISCGKIVSLAVIRAARKKFLHIITSTEAKQDIKTGFHPYDVLINSLRQNPLLQQSSYYNENIFKEFLLITLPAMESGFSTMATCASAAPLIGLLGTITGMNKMFAVINEFGLGNPTLMADGISVALQCTLAGLTVAVVVMFLLNYLSNKKDKLRAIMLNDVESLKNKNGIFSTL